MGERITFDRPDGGECPAYYVKPDAGDGAPGVVYSRSGGAWTNTSVSQKEQQARRCHGLLHGRRALNPGGDPRC